MQTKKYQSCVGWLAVSALELESEAGDVLSRLGDCAAMVVLFSVPSRSSLRCDGVAPVSAAGSPSRVASEWASGQVTAYLGWCTAPTAPAAPAAPTVRKGTTSIPGRQSTHALPSEQFVCTSRVQRGQEQQEQEQLQDRISTGSAPAFWATDLDLVGPDRQSVSAIMTMASTALQVRTSLSVLVYNSEYLPDLPYLLALHRQKRLSTLFLPPAPAAAEARGLTLAGLVTTMHKGLDRSLDVAADREGDGPKSFWFLNTTGPSRALQYYNTVTAHTTPWLLDVSEFGVARINSSGHERVLFHVIGSSPAKTGSWLESLCLKAWELQGKPRAVLWNQE
ncbi:hypothetical protein FHL15_005159 [Xylaria flabelliformis]|uniref:Uncharacterized protein n=1 Tax=Xylaria flabelliformis TaxID=2512241 RepID=A0A553I1L5_9PEZI|nr:hypothetical protein FHL15_005159 [Xylaria flabelliformis]